MAEVMVDGQWNHDELKKWLSSWEIEEIRKIPISLHQGEDTWTWQYSKNGEFSVRSAYFLELTERKKEQATSSGGSNNVVWRKIWQANLPTKIRIFGWKAMHQGLPMRVALRRRGCVLDCICPMCGEENEIVSHALLRCPEAQRVWGQSLLRLSPPADFEGSMFEWVMQVSRNVNEDAWWDLLWSLMWGIWLRRNA